MLPAGASVPYAVYVPLLSASARANATSKSVPKPELIIPSSTALVAASTEDAILLLMRISTRPSSCTISMGESAEQAANTDSKTPLIYKIHLFRFISILYIG